MVNGKEFFLNNKDILEILLKDRTTKNNIIYATTMYPSISVNDFVKVDHVLSFIKSRVEKTKTDQIKRSKDMAEVFTPSWVCNEQNNLLDEGYFGKKNVFNIANNKTWIPTENIECDEYQWQTYLKALMLEITCGECPYLVSRYDTVTGESIDLFYRIGLFDRKMRIVCEKAIGGGSG